MTISCSFRRFISWVMLSFQEEHGHCFRVFCGYRVLIQGSRFKPNDYKFPVMKPYIASKCNFYCYLLARGQPPFFSTLFPNLHTHVVRAGCFLVFYKYIINIIVQNILIY